MVFEGVNKSFESFVGWIVWKLNLLDIFPFFPPIFFVPFILSDFSSEFLPAEKQVVLNSSAQAGGSDRHGPFAGWCYTPLHV